MDSVRTRSWSGDSKNYCVWYFDKGFWHEMYHGKICSVASATRAEGTLCCSCWWLDSNCYQWTRFPQEAHNQRWIMGLRLWSRNKGTVIPMELPGSPRLKKAWQICSKTKTMLTVFFDWEGVAHHEYTPPGQTINKKYYLNVLHHLRLWAAGDWQLHHNNVPTHASCLVQRFLVKHQITQVTQAPTAQIWCPAISGFSTN